MPKQSRTAWNLETKDQQMYMMQGNKFQSDFTHEVPAGKCQGMRIALTFRLTTTGFSGSIPVSESRLQVIEHFTNLTFVEVYNDIKDSLEPDITNVWNKRSENAGRMTADFVNWKEPSKFTYRYSGHTGIGKPMTGSILKLCKDLLDKTGRIFDWCHVVVYPSGACKLGAHSDNEKVIAVGSDIACISFMQNPKEFRRLICKRKE